MPESQGYLMPEPSWDLRVFVPDLQADRTLRVRGDMHIGGIMLKLVEELDISVDWSDHAFWWPKKNTWLTKTRQTLNHYGVQADSFLNFTPMHKPLKVQLPDLRYVDAKVNFSVECFTAVKLLCKELGIRHSEELSFCRPLSQEHLKRNYQNVGVTPRQRGYVANGANGQNDPNLTMGNNSHYGSMRASGTMLHDDPTRYNTIGSTRGGAGYSIISQAGTIDTRSHSPDITSSLSRHASYRGFTSTYSTTMLVEDLKNLEISNSPHTPSSDAKASLLYPKNLAEKARLNAGWLDSHLSLYQQNVRDYDTLQLRFKYREFYDLNPKLDMARINQIYEQAKWSLLTEEVECSEDEMMMFGALQYQIQQQASNPIPDDLDNTNDDIDAALTELQLQLEGGSTTTTTTTTTNTVYDRTSFNTGTLRNNNNSLSSYQQHSQNTMGTATAPASSINNLNNSMYPNDPLSNLPIVSTMELCDFIRFMRLKKFTFKTFKRLYFVFHDTTLTAYRNKDEPTRSEPAFAIDLRGCDVTPDVSIQHRKFGVKLSTPSSDGMTMYLMRFDSEQQYARWMAAFKLASRGMPLSDPSYEEEVRTTMESFNFHSPAAISSSQHQLLTNPNNTLSLTSNNNNNHNINNNNNSNNNNNNNYIRIDDYVAPKHSKNRNRVGRSAATRILEAHTNVKYLSATDCKLNYIKAWRALHDFGVHMFVVKFDGSNREEILGIASDRLIRIDASNGDHLRVWPYSRMKTWRVNWNSRQVLVQCEDGEMSFSCLSAECKIPHEFIGGYVFLSMRTKDSNQTLNESQFYKLTRGWDD